MELNQKVLIFGLIKAIILDLIDPVTKVLPISWVELLQFGEKKKHRLLTLKNCQHPQRRLYYSKLKCLINLFFFVWKFNEYNSISVNSTPRKNST